MSATFAVEDASTGSLRGPTVTLGAALADALGVSVSYIRYSSSGAVTAAGPRNQSEVTFVQRDPDRAAVIDVGPDYSVFDSTFMVRAGLDAMTISELDTAGSSVGAVNSTTTGRAAARTLDHATLTSYDSVDEMRDLLNAGEIDAIALGRLTLTSLAPTLPGARILEEGFHATATAVAVPQGHSAALAYVTAFVEDAKRSGLARRALDDAGLGAAQVAPTEIQAD
jgi:polar amino acid transport system substrate-binding protein